MTSLSKIDHIAIATFSLAETLDFYTNKLGLKLQSTEILENRGIKVAFLQIGEVNIELMEPLNEQSEISSFLNKKGPGIHHIAFATNDIKESCSFLSKHQIKLISQQPTLGAHDTLVNFIHPKSSFGVLIELVEHAS
jgi:methylmalonyl-CoA epimerase